MKTKDIAVLAAIIAAAYGTSVKQEIAQINAAFKCVTKDMKA